MSGDVAPALRSGHGDRWDVGCVETDDDGVIATRLAAGWIYLAPTDSTTGFPTFVAAAMALGLPCLVLGSPEHSDLLSDGETGYLCSTETEVMERIGRLIDEVSLRRQIGQAGRREAERRSSPERFRAALLRGLDGRAARHATDGSEV